MCRLFFGLIACFICTSFVAACRHKQPLPQRQDLDFIQINQVLLTSSKSEKCLTPSTFYEDADGDGFGNPSKSVQACVAPPKTVTDGTDCADDDPRAFPGQTQFFHTPRPDGSYDFDCDGKSSIRLTQRASCEEDPATRKCSATSGWDGKVPDCGQAGEWSWNECRTELVADPPTPSDMPVDTPPVSIPSPQKTVSHCWSGKLGWKKRQLCR